MGTPHVFVEPTITEPNYRHDRDVSSLGGDVPPPGMRRLGLTQFQAKLNFRVSTNSVTILPGRYCTGATEIHAKWEMTRMDVDIDRVLLPGSCAYRVTHTHEGAHVSVGRRVFTAYIEKIRAKTRAVAAVMRPRPTDSPAKEAEFLTYKMSKELQPLIDEFKAELRRLNGALDTPAAYRAEAAKCADWP